MQKKILTVLLTLIVFGYISSITHGGTTYHVDADNQNIGDGSETNPFQTIEKGLEAATQGDKVLVHKVDGSLNDPRGTPTKWDHYLLSNSLTIEAGETLELELGVVIKFKYYTNTDKNPSIIVDGCLRALGKPGGGENSVYFTSERDNSVGDSTYTGQAPERGDWYHIVFQDGSSSDCLIEHTEIRYAGRFWWRGYTSWGSRAEEAILIKSATPVIQDTTVKNVFGYCLECDLISKPVLRRLAFDNSIKDGQSINALHISCERTDTIDGDSTWSNTDVVYYLDQTVKVGASGRLTMPPGLVVKFQYSPQSDVNPSLDVYGCLRLQGTFDQPIILTSNRDDKANVPDGTGGDTNNDGDSDGERGDWYHIVFEDSSSSDCLIEHTEIRYAGRFWWRGYTSWGSRAEEAILIMMASPTIRDTSFLQCWGYPVEMDLDSFPKMQDLKAQGLDSEDISAVHIVGGTMASGGTWSNPGIPYYLDDSVTVASGEMLVIDPGTVVKFKIMDNIGLYFDRSKLNARQVADESIVFTSIRDDDIAGDTNNDGPSDGLPGDWGQISLARTGRPNVGVRHAVFRYAGNGTGNAKIPALLLDFTDAEILNCSFEESSDVGIKVDGASNADIRDLVSMRNSVGVHVAGGSFAAITGWTSFQDQTALLVDNAEAEVCNSILSYYSFTGTGGYGVQVVNDGSLDISNSNVWSPWGTSYSTPPGDQTGVDNNISTNPGFADIYTDNLHLKSDSPCRDTGDDVSIVYHSDVTIKGGTSDTIIVDPGTAANYVVSDWIEYNDDSALRRITGIDIGLTETTLTIIPLLSEPSQAGASIKDYGSGDMDLHPRMSDSHVDMGAAEYNTLFLDSECVPKTHPSYAEWIDVGKPSCWCGLYATAARPRQCHGDADGISQGKNKYWISTNDLDIMIAAWNKPFAEIEGQKLHGIDLICADFDHLPQGKNEYRVSINDLDILIANWQLTDGPDPDCP